MSGLFPPASETTGADQQPPLWPPREGLRSFSGSFLFSFLFPIALLSAWLPYPVSAI